MLKIKTDTIIFKQVTLNTQISKNAIAAHLLNQIKK
jgi:hypothetical protein